MGHIPIGKKLKNILNRVHIFLLGLSKLQQFFSFAGNAEDEEQACRWDHHKKEKE